MVVYYSKHANDWTVGIAMHLQFKLYEYRWYQCVLV